MFLYFRYTYNGIMYILTAFQQRATNRNTEAEITRFYTDNYYLCIYAYQHYDSYTNLVSASVISCIEALHFLTATNLYWINNFIIGAIWK